MMNIGKIEEMEVPKQVFIPMAQNYDHHCLPAVSVGEHVKVGQPIAYAGSADNAPIHSSVSGNVISIAENKNLQGVDDDVIVIECDGKQELWEGIKKPTINSREDFLNALRESGMIGLEGACLATHAKLDEETIKNDKTLVINGAEWTKYAEFEWTLMKEDAENIIDGASLTMKFMELDNCYIGVYETEKNAVNALVSCIRERKLEEKMKVVELPQSCPPGSDRVIIYETTGEILAANNLPEDFGIVVASLYSIAFFGSYIKSGLPLVRKVISIDGTAVKKAKPLIVPIGARVCDIMDYCGGYSTEPKTIVLGGPAIARPIADQKIPLSKDNNSILAFEEETIPIRTEISCKNCDRCKRVCPIHLAPELLFDAFEQEDKDQLKALGLEKCTECGRCAFVCPAAKPLSYMIEQAKILIQ